MGDAQTKPCDFNLPFKIYTQGNPEDDCYDPTSPEYLQVPFELIEDKFYDCDLRKKLPVPGGILEVYAHCGTTGCFTGAYVMPASDALRPVISDVIRKLWAEYVEEVEVWYWDGHSFKVTKWRKKPEDVIRLDSKIDAEYCLFGGKEKGEYAVFRLPYRRLRQLLEGRLKRATILLEEAKRELEELEKRIERSEKNGELEIEVAEQLRRKVHDVISLFDADELDVEL